MTTVNTSNNYWQTNWWSKNSGKQKILTTHVVQSANLLKCAINMQHVKNLPSFCLKKIKLPQESDKCLSDEMW